jgi:hypothetical protein
MYVKKMAKKGVNKFPNHNATCRIFILMDDKYIDRIS